MGIIVGVLAVTTFFAGLAIREVSAGSQAQMSIGFESGWDSGWSANDYDSASGLDYWGISTYRSFSGTHSAYCAEVGTSSVNSIANNVNHYYDQDMSAWLDIPIGDFSAWSSATLSFYAWYVTGSWSLADYLRVLNSSDGTNWWVQWTQTELSSSGWQRVSFNLPTATTFVSFWFISDPTVGWGPYEGVYIDDIVVTVTDSSSPVSSVSPLTTYQTTSSFSIHYTSSDLGGSDLAYVELYYRHGDSGAFTAYTTGANPSGHWTASPIAFDSSGSGGDGLYQFYTCAVDNSGNRESAPLSPDASTTVDATKPATSVGLAGTIGSDGWYTSSVTVTLVSSDTMSGVASTTYSLDSGDWLAYLNSFSISQEGVHTMEFYSVDNAGNTEAQKEVTIKVDTTPPELVIISPTEGSYVNDSVLLIWQCSDNLGVGKEEVSADGFTWQTMQSGLPIYGPTGERNIRVRVTDLAGNQVVQSVNFTRDINAPTLAIAWPPADSFISGSTYFSYNASDDFGIAKVEYRIDSGPWADAAYWINVSDGRHTIQVRITDLAGNFFVEEINVTSDTVKPVVTVSSPATNSKIDRNVVIVSWTGSDALSGIDHYEVQISGGQWINVGNTTSYEFTGLDDTWYSVTVKAVDKSNNEATTRVSFGIYTSIWSQNGPYQGMPLFALIAGIVAIVALSLLLWYRRGKSSPPEPVSEDAPKTE
jgi:hypothetical protein